jgi:16S rRNA G527 N7-methylase RsmG
LEALAPLVSPKDLASTAERFRVYLGSLVAWNVRSNLVAAGDRDRLVRRHIVESLGCVPLLDELGGSTLLDLGSGGGFPGIPIKLVRLGLEIALVESRRMKSLFLRRTIESLGLRGTPVWQARVETIAALPLEPEEAPEDSEQPGAPPGPGREEFPGRRAAAGAPSPPAGEARDGGGRVEAPRVDDPEIPSVRPVVDLVTSRAVAALGKTTQWVAPLVRPGGFLVTFKGSRADEEVEAWRSRPGPWELARVERSVRPGLTLVALRRLAS